MADAEDEHGNYLVFDKIDNPVVADSDPIQIVMTPDCLGCRWSWVPGKRVYAGLYSPLNSLVIDFPESLDR
jgi:hypothetical protein